MEALATSFSIPEFLNDQRSLTMFFFADIVLGGLAAALAGRAIATSWRPWWHVLVYMMLLAVGVRFLHYSVFGSTFLSLHYYLVDAVVCLIFGFLFYRMRRVDQMVSCYKWINRRAGPLRWHPRAHDAAGSSGPG
jgi:hypothetical protein